MTEVVYIACCPEHGLHGCRDSCHECGGPVEQVGMVPALAAEALREITDYPLSEDRSAAFHFAEVRRIAREALEAVDLGGVPAEETSQ